MASSKDKAKATYQIYVPEAKLVPEWWKNYNFVLITSMSELKDVFSKYESGKYYMSFDTETTGLDFEKLNIVGYSFCIDGKTTYYVPVNHFEYEYNLGEDACDFIYLMMVNAKMTFFFNYRYDARVFEYIGYKSRKKELDKFRWMYAKYDMSKVNYFDVMVPCWLADSNNKQCSLKWSSRHFLGYEQMHFDEVIDEAGNFYYLNPTKNPDVVFYAGADALCTYLLVPVTMKYYKESGLAGQLDNKILYPLMHYEEEKMYLDGDMIYRYEIEAEKEINELEAKVYEMFGGSINLNSPIQVSQAMQRLGIDTGEMTDSGNMAVGIKVLDKLSEEVISRYPALKSYKEYKEVSKLMSAYIQTFKKEYETRGFIRAAYKTTFVPTGRLAAGKDGKNSYFSPINVQAIPKPHVAMYSVYKVGDERLFSKEDNIIMGYRFIKTKYGEDKNPIIDNSIGEYIGESEGMDPHLNMRATILPIEHDSDEIDDWVYASFDFSAEELRIAANVSNEPVWKNAFLEGRDVHRSTAESIWGKENYNRDYRKKAKSCFSASSLFFTDSGVVRGYELAGNELIDLSGNKQKYNYFIEDRDGYEIELSNGDIVEVTDDHKFKLLDTFEDNTWIEAKELSVGRQLGIVGLSHYGDYQIVRLEPNRKNKETTLVFDERIAYLCGFYLGDGNLDGESLRLTVKEDNKEYIEGILQSFGKITQGRSGEDWVNISISSKQLRDFIFNNFGRTTGKYIGDIVFKSPRTVMLSFLAGLLDSDGKIGSSEVSFSNKNLLLIRGVAKLVSLLGFTVVSFSEYKGVLKAKYRKNCGEDYICTYYIIRLSFEDSIFEIPLKINRSLEYLNNRKRESIYYSIINEDRDKFKTLGNYVTRGNFTDGRSKKISRKISKNIGDWRYRYIPVSIVSIKPKRVTAICLECDTHFYIADGFESPNCNFGIIYGMGAASFKDNPLFGFKTMAEAEAFYEHYKNSLPTLFQWEERVQQRARKVGTAYTFFGRPRRVKGYYDNHNFAFANRTACNTSIQGAAGDILKITMCKIWKNILNNPEYRDDVRWMITIHDEIGYAIRASRLPEIAKLIKETQTFKISQWPVEIPTDLSAGFSVGSIFEFKFVDNDGTERGYHFEPSVE